MKILIKIKKYNFIAFICSCCLMFGQETEGVQLPDIVPPSPDAFAFATFGNIPLNGSTGGFNYSVPLFGLKNGDIIIQTSLDYFSDGVKIDKLSSVVGTDWVLNAGGVISRVVRDEPDEKAMYRWYPTTIDFSQDYNKVKTAASSEDQSYDTEQDWFSFNVNGISGKFYMDEDLNITVDSDSPILITNNGFSSFEITDENGYKYIFGGLDEYKETNLSSNTCSHIRDTYISAWYLSKIISPTNRQVTFRYQKNSLYYATAISNNLTLEEDCYCSPSAKSYDYNHQKCVSYNRISAPIISEIIANDSKIVFNYLDNRLDMINGNGALLDQVILYYNNNPIESFKLNHVTTTSSNHFDDKLSGDNSLKYRIFLSSLIKKNSQGSKNHEYKFEYYNKESLPCRLSYNKDIYGYYNGANNTKPFAYPKDPKAYEIARRYASYLLGANQDPNPEQAKYGVLSKITYPTGGHTEVVYEGNSDVVLVDSEDEESHSIYLSKECNVITNASDSFTFVSNGSPINYNVNATVDTYICNSEPDPLHDQYSLSIRDLTTGETIRAFSRDQGENVKTDPILQCGGYNEYNKPICTVNGHTYEITFTVSSKFSQISGRADIWYNRETEQVEEIGLSGGVRVKQISDFDGTNEYNKRSFHYNSMAQLGAQNTSLNIINEPKFSSFYMVEKNCVPECCSNESGVGFATCQSDVMYLNSLEKERYFISVGSLQSLYNNRKQSNYYSVVSEILEEAQNNNGAIERYFHYVNDSKPAIIRPPEIPNTPYTNVSDVFFGVVDSVNYYEHKNNIFNKVKKESYKYSIVHQEESRSTVFSKNFDYTGIGVPQETVDNISITQYKNIIQKKRLKSRHTVLYDNSSDVSTTENYTYGPSPYYNMKEKQLETSTEGYTQTTNYFYPPDKATLQNLTSRASAAIDQLILQHRISSPVQVKTTLKNNNATVLSKTVQRTNYRNWPNNITMPEYIQTSKDKQSLKNRIEYLSYDSKGNPLEVKKVNGSTISYFWGYNGQYPVAKVENATYAEVMATGVNLSVLESTTSTEPAKLAELNKIRNHSSMSGAMVTTYTYDPLVGVSTITDPRGVKTDYDYDSFNRLEFIKDETGKLLEEYKYHYKN
ncbi:hypothetical protein OOZ15_11765 [Galbibacter sp. EGI 63066]|uniref:hypothetical protein n=1 Tax=Galbibacter sp. EGI 63066 TaxID=2993559 RepID=UPI0022488FBE|nr:hypothetical protein [Galbibacter sp. EGI 63066]MCX2680620.1 hypothetical protein [Galbibacter sp. EGI 63066]